MYLRAWATPLIIGSFLVMAVTGGLLFFHLNSGLNKGLHEWAGMAMVAGGVAHVVLNWRAFTLYFRRPVAEAIMAAFAVLLGLSFLLPGSGGGVNPGTMIQTLSAARIETLAELTGQDAGALTARLVAGGYADASPDQTVKTLAGGDMGQQAAILGTALAQP